MRLSRFFITRPIFAAVIAILITVMGAIAYFALPVSQYPDIVPPTVTVSATYPGADAETVASTVAAPIEQEINGVDNMLYMSSQSTGDGRLTITVTFKQGTDLNAAQVLVQNRVAIAAPRLPEEVQRLGVVTRKTSPDFLMVVNLVSPNNTLDRGYMSNYALTQVRDRLARIDGVGDVQLFGARDYAMRVWIDPNRAAALDLTAGEIVNALRAQNVQVAAGTLGQPPYDSGNAFQLNVETQGRLTDPAQFANVVIRTDADGRQVRVSDVARVELGAADYASNTYLSGQPTVLLAVFQRPGSNALAAAAAVKAEMKAASKTFPPGLEYRIIYNPTEFISQSIDAVMHTLLEAIAAGRARHHRLPAALARGSHSGGRDSGFADRHLRGASGGRLFAQQPVAVRAGAGDRHRRRRRDRRGRECRAQPRPRPLRAGGGADVDGRGRGGADRDRAGALRGVPSDPVPQRTCGRLLSPVRGDDFGCDGDLAAAVADAVARARGAAAQAACGRSHGQCRGASCCAVPAPASIAASSGSAMHTPISLAGWCTRRSG